jgi:hypothetical protein
MELAGGFIFLIIILEVFWLWMMFDVLTAKMDGGNKLLWALVVFFFNLLGAVLYFFIGRKQKKPKLTNS